MNTLKKAFIPFAAVSLPLISACAQEEAPVLNMHAPATIENIRYAEEHDVSLTVTRTDREHLRVNLEQCSEQTKKCAYATIVIATAGHTELEKGDIVIPQELIEPVS
jgi:hypothetical protein